MGRGEERRGEEGKGGRGGEGGEGRGGGGEGRGGEGRGWEGRGGEGRGWEGRGGEGRGQSTFMLTPQYEMTPIQYLFNSTPLHTSGGLLNINSEAKSQKKNILGEECPHFTDTQIVLPPQAENPV